MTVLINTQTDRKRITEQITNASVKMKYLIISIYPNEIINFFQVTAIIIHKEIKFEHTKAIVFEIYENMA